MKRFILLLAASALLAAVLCGCETGAGTSHTNPPKVTANVTSSPAPATPTPEATPTPDVTAAPDVTEAPDATPAIPDATDAPETERPGDTGTDTGNGEVPQPRRGGLM